MMEIYIVGEDPVTCEILKRIISDYAPSLMVKGALPARGSEIKSKMAAFNLMASSYPVVLLSDMDTDDCAPIAKNNLTKGIAVIHDNFIINIAVDEAEAWLLADRDGLAKYLGVKIEVMPIAEEQKFGGMHKRTEMAVSLKSSYFLTHNIISTSTDKELKAQISAPGKACKGPEYNSAIVPFIQNSWNIEMARKNSYSLDKAIMRIQSLQDRCMKE